MVALPSSPLAGCRLAAGYTQESVAEKLGVDRSTVGRWERGVQSPQPWQRPGLAAALEIKLDHLDDVLRRTTRIPGASAVVEHPAPLVCGVAVPRLSARPASDGGRDLTGGEAAVFGHDAVHAAIPRLRRALDRIDLPDDGPTRPAADLGAEVARMLDHRLQARYIQLARHLPDLICELARATQSSHSHRSGEVAALVTLAFRAADALAYKFGYLDLSARIIDLMRSSALAADDPLLVAAVAYVRTETFFATGDLVTASQLLDSAAEHLSAGWEDSASAAASYGALHMRAAVVAGRAGKSDTAWDHLDEARRAARQVPDGVYLGTAFGPSSVRIHELAVTVELGASSARVHHAATWHPPRHLPAERRYRRSSVRSNPGRKYWKVSALSLPVAVTAPSTAENVCRETPTQAAQAAHSRESSSTVCPTRTPPR